MINRHSAAAVAKSAGTLADIFNIHRSHLFAIAYRMVGTVMDAEDLVQEAYLRWQQTAPNDVDSPKAYLSTIVTRLSIDHLRSAKVQRETYVGQWLPEPLVHDETDDVVEHAALAESLSMAFLVLLEQLNPTERAVFLLREIFDYDYAEIAQIVGKREANCRQLVRRARQHIAQRRPRYEPSYAKKEELLHRFIIACTEGDVANLEGLLAADVMSRGDGGGKVPSAPKPIIGRARVTHLFLTAIKKIPPNATVNIICANGQPAIAILTEDKPFSLILPDIADGQIRAFYNIFTPDKLGQL